MSAPIQIKGNCSQCQKSFVPVRRCECDAPLCSIRCYMNHAITSCSSDDSPFEQSVDISVDMLKLDK